MGSVRIARRAGMRHAVTIRRMLKMAVFAPIPKLSVSTMTAVNPACTISRPPGYSSRFVEFAWGQFPQQGRVTSWRVLLRYIARIP